MDEDVEVRRVQRFLVSLRAVWLGRAALTEVGAAYLGVPFHFPMAEDQMEAPVYVEVLRWHDSEYRR